MVIDTSVFIEYLRASDKTTTTLWALPDGTALHVSVITLYELHLGATTPSKQQDVTTLLRSMTLLPLTPAIAEEAAQNYRDLRSRNQLIGHRDLFIAATALVHNLPVKTLNQKHFSRIKGLLLA
jgi:tRNA(fMet)-specific endonuclease VapC